MNIFEILRFKILTFQESIYESKNGKSEEQARSKCIEMMTLENRLRPQTLASLLSISASWDIKHHENIEYMSRKLRKPTKYSSVYLFHFSCHVPDSAIIRGERTISDLNNKTCQWAIVWNDEALKTYLLHILPLYRYLSWTIKWVIYIIDRDHVYFGYFLKLLYSFSKSSDIENLIVQY